MRGTDMDSSDTVIFDRVDDHPAASAGPRIAT